MQYRQAQRSADSSEPSLHSRTTPTQELRCSESTSSISSGHSAELGLHSIALLEEDFSLVFGTTAPSSQPPGTSDLSTPPVSEHETEEERAARLHAEDLAAVKAELHRYKEDRLSGPNINLKSFWKVSRATLSILRLPLIMSCPQDHREEYPLLYRVALDILPVPASAVASERVFSSSKETDRLRRSRLSGAMMEVLQVIKFSLKQRLREGVGPQLLSRPEDLEEGDGLDELPPILTAED